LIEQKSSILKSSYHAYCSERLDNCTIPDPDPSIEKEINQLSVKGGKYGKTIDCESGNVLVATCGSGNNPNCGGVYHKEYCSTKMTYELINTEEKASHYGDWDYCSSGAIVSICRSGRKGDCNGAWQRFTCNTDIPILTSDC